MSKLYLIPTPLHEDNLTVIPSVNLSIIKDLRIFFVEEIKSAQKFLKRAIAQFPIQECSFHVLNEHTKPNEIQEYLKLIREKDSGIISEAGLPCVADPGSDLVFLAQKNQVQVVPLTGPSSILLALMSSGLNGQSFAFHGYLPRESTERIKRIKELESRSSKEHQTQIFMETPYRNQNMFEDILKSCDAKTHLCIAMNLTGTNEWIRTRTISDWKKNPPTLSKEPAIFLLEKRP
jgi:16S rRNA (cytidine1402-2'-O)-methyltransferase